MITVKLITVEDRQTADLIAAGLKLHFKYNQFSVHGGPDGSEEAFEVHCEQGNLSAYVISSMQHYAHGVRFGVVTMSLIDAGREIRQLHDQQKGERN